MGKLQPGDKAPDFELKDQNSHVVRLSDFAGRKLLLYFYPMAGTPACTKQACHVRDARADLSALDIAVVGISPDAPERQLAFDRRRSLGFPLLSDTDYNISRAFGVLLERQIFRLWLRWPRRSAFLIDEAGVIRKAWYGVSAADTVANAIRASTC